MRLLGPLALIAPLLSTTKHSLAIPISTSPHPHLQKRVKIYDFHISELTILSLSNRDTSSWNRTLSFNFLDLNNNSSTTCSTTWTESSTNTNTASSPVLNEYFPCETTGREEDFEWLFNGYTGSGGFELQFYHGFNDPVHWPAPYSYVDMYSRFNDVSLQCIEGAFLEFCYLPADADPYVAVINMIAD